MAWRRPFSRSVVWRRCMFWKVLLPNLRGDKADMLGYSRTGLWAPQGQSKRTLMRLNINVMIGVLGDMVRPN